MPRAISGSASSPITKKKPRLRDKKLRARHSERFQFRRRLLQSGHHLPPLNKPKESRQNFEKAVAITPNDALSLYNLGVLQIRDLERNKALATFRQAVTADPKLAEAHFFLGGLLQEQGQKKSAEAELDLTIRLSPQLALPRVFISAILESDGDTTRAKDELNKALSLNKAALNIGYGYEDFYFKEGKGSDILNRVREIPKAPLPPKLASRSAPAEPSAPEKEESFEPKREAREMAVESKPEPSEENPPAPPPKKIQPTVASRNHRVRRGDTLSKIALRHRTDPDTLIRLNLNRIEHPSILEVGNLIRVPASQNGRASPKPQKTVKRKKRTYPQNVIQKGAGRPLPSLPRPPRRHLGKDRRQTQNFPGNSHSPQPEPRRTFQHYQCRRLGPCADTEK